MSTQFPWAMEEVLWSGRPYIKKSIVKAVIFFILLTLLTIWVTPLWSVLFLIYWLPMLVYLYWKKSHYYRVKPNSVLIVRDWVFGRYQREITFDQIRDVHVQQGLLARLMGCGSVVFVTTSGLEVGYVGVGATRRISGGVAVPVLQRGWWNSFLDVPHPEAVREIVMNRLVAWREAYQQQRIATAIEKISGVQAGGTSVADELAKLKQLLDQGAITKEEYEALKKKLIG